MASLSPVLPVPKLACNIDGPARIEAPTATQMTVTDTTRGVVRVGQGCDSVPQSRKATAFDES